MNRTGSSCSEEMQNVTVEILRPPIQTFVDRMTEDQWTLLKIGCPDNATKILLAELLLDIIQAVTNFSLASLKNTCVNISEEQVQVKLGDTLAQSFGEALDIKNPDQCQCISSERLTNLLAKEITKSISSALSAHNATEPGFSKHITPPIRLNNMIKHASKMLKTFVARCGKMKKCTSRARRQTASQTASQDLASQYLEVKEDNDSCQSEGEEPQTPEEDPLQDPFVAETAKEVQGIIEKAVSDITQPLLQDVSDSEYQLLQSETSSDIEVVSIDIAKIIASEVETSTPESKQKRRVSLEGVGSVIKNFFAKLLIKASIHRLVAQLKSKFHQQSEAESSQSMEVLFPAIEDVLMELCVFPRYKTLSGTNVVEISKELTEMIYCYIKYGNMMPDIIPEAIRRKAVAVPKFDAAMYKDVQKKVRCFLALINWWQKTQAASHSKIITLALQDPVSVSQTQSAEVNAEQEHASLIPNAAPASKHRETRSRSSKEDTALVERKKLAVLFLVEKLVSRLYNKAEVNWTTTQPEVIIQRLFQRIWAEVEGEEITITPETFEELDKAVFKHLMKGWGCATNVLVSLTLQGPVSEKIITYQFRHHLMAKKRCAVSRFFSALGKAISKPFRRAPRFGVI
eukprot:superscaffoldBa00003623_g17346